MMSYNGRIYDGDGIRDGAVAEWEGDVGDEGGREQDADDDGDVDVAEADEAGVLGGQGDGREPQDPHHRLNHHPTVSVALRQEREGGP